MSRNIWVDRYTQVVVDHRDSLTLTVSVFTRGKPKQLLLDVSSASHKEDVAKLAVRFVKAALGMLHAE